MELLNILSELLPSTSLSINCDKSFTFSWLSNKKHKKTIFHSVAVFYVVSVILRSFQLTDEFICLRVCLTSNGRVFKSPPKRFDLAKLKSQQKLYLLRNILIPKYYHQLVLRKMFCRQRLKKLIWKCTYSNFRTMSHLAPFTFQRSMLELDFHMPLPLAAYNRACYACSGLFLKTNLRFVLFYIFISPNELRCPNDCRFNFCHLYILHFHSDQKFPRKI